MAAGGELVVSIIGDMEGLKKTLQGVQTEIGNMGKGFSKLGSDLTSAGSGLTAGFTVPITAAVAAGAGLVSWASNIEQSQGKVQASLGLTAEEADSLNQSAMNVWKQGFGTDIENVNGVIVSIRQNMGDLAGVELEQVTTGALTIANTFGEDVNQITATSGVLMKNFGIDGQKALDLITVGYQKGGNYSGELLDTLREYSPQFQSMGLSAEDFLGILISGAQSGAWNMDKIGDSVKEFNIRAQDGSDTTAAGFAAIGLNAGDMAQKISAGGDSAKTAFMATVAGLVAMKDPVQQNIAGVNLFGTQWEDVRKNVIGAAKDGIGSIKDVSGATQKATDDVKASNPMAELTSAMRDMQTEILPIVTDEIIPMVKEDLIPIFRDTLIPILKNDIIPAVEGVIKTFRDMDPVTQKIVLAIIAFAAAAGPVLVILGVMASAIGSIAGLFAAGGLLASGGAIMTALGAAIGLLASPITILIGVVALLAIAWSRDWGGIREKAAAVWDYITTGAANLYNRLEYYYHAIEMAASTLKTNLGTIWNILSSAFSTTVNLIIGLVTLWYNQVKNYFNQIVAAAQSLLNSWRAHWDSLRNILNDAVNNVLNYLSNLYSRAQNYFNQIVAAAQSLLNSWRAHWDSLRNILNDAVNNVLNYLSNLYSRAQNYFNQIVAAAQNLLNQWRQRWNDIENRISDAKTAIYNKLQDIKTDAETKAGQIADSILKPLSEIKTKIENLFSDIKQAGKNLVQNLIDGINEMIKPLETAVDKVTSAAAEYLPMNSPSKVGALSTLPHWEDFFEVPINANLARTKGALEAGLGDIAGTINRISNTSGAVSNVNYEGSQITIGPNTLSNQVDIQALIDEINRRVTAQRRARGYIL